MVFKKWWKKTICKTFAGSPKAYEPEHDFKVILVFRLFSPGIFIKRILSKKPTVFKIPCNTILIWRFGELDKFHHIF